MVRHNIFGLVSHFFNDDIEKSYAWFTSIHPTFGLRPIDMLRKGKHDKLLKYVLSGINKGRI